MIVKNDSKSVIVLKAVGLPALRLFPGYNKVDKNEVGKYFEGNPAAQGHQKMSLSVVDGNEMTAEDKAKADKAKEKNDLLNKAQRVIQKNEKELSKNSRTISDQAGQIKELQAKMEAMEEMLTAGGEVKTDADDKGKGKSKK